MIKLTLWLGTLVFGCGVFGFLTRRNLILMFLSLELMLFGVSLNFVAFGKLHGNLGGQTFAIMILTVAACEAALALALIVTLYRSRGTLDVNIWQSLREESQQMAAKQFDALVSPDDNDLQREDSYGELPKLTPAGHDPFLFPVKVDGQRQEPAGLA
jgi:NADH-quinone oxidoreductase subunit K